MVRTVGFEPTRFSSNLSGGTFFMFFYKQRYTQLQGEHWSLMNKYNDLALKWEKLVKEINAKGGRTFLDNGFSQEEIKQLILLCHPDKHGNSSISNEITCKLLKLRANT
jgi:hypothetical protein